MRVGASAAPWAEPQDASLPELGSLIASDVLHLILMPTERCNFRCTYCYEDFAQGKMSPSLVRAITLFLRRRAPELRSLSLSWFGGEPMLALDVVETIQSAAQDLAAENPSLRLRGSMTTNGYLLNQERLLRLLSLGVDRYQVSLDGPAEFHDRRRKQAGGRGSFDQIWSNLEAARDLDETFEVKLRIHVDRETVGVMPDLIQHLAEAFGGDSRFLVHIRRVSRLGGANDENLPILEGSEAGGALEGLRAQAKRLGLALGEGGNPASACYAAAANSFVLRSNGDIGKCTVALSDARNRVGRMLPDGRLELDSDLMMEWTRGIWSESSQALHCPLQGLSSSAAVSQATALVQLGAPPAPTQNGPAPPS